MISFTARSTVAELTLFVMSFNDFSIDTPEKAFADARFISSFNAPNSGLDAFQTAFSKVIPALMLNEIICRAFGKIPSISFARESTSFVTRK